MRHPVHVNLITGLLLCALLIGFNSCLTPAKMNKFVGEQYNNQLPRKEKMRNQAITISSPLASEEEISNTVKRTHKMLPLLVYWKYDYRHTCTLNPAFAISHFSKMINSNSGKLTEKLNGRQLELSVEQVPTAFALVDKGNIVFVGIYAFSWNKFYMEPDFKELVVSYRVSEKETAGKSGKITVSTTDQNKNIRFAQSWKSSTSDYLARYQLNINEMSREFVKRLIDEL